jgi:hypothetical protein
MSSDKPKADRLREGMEILRKLQEFGVGRTDPGFQEVQGAIAAWVSTGTAAQHRISLSRQERVAEIVLPRRAMNTATCRLVLFT